MCVVSDLLCTRVPAHVSSINGSVEDVNKTAYISSSRMNDLGS